MKLNDSTVVPLYIQLKNELKEEINKGTIQIGDKIPSEYELCDRYGVSRITVRTALADLQKEGYLEKKQGKGSFAKRPRITRPLEDSIGFSESCRKLKMKSSSLVLQRSIIIADEFLAKKLQIKKGNQVIYIQRLRMADGDPIMIENNYYDDRMYHFLLDEPLTGSLYELLKKKKGIVCDRSIHTVITVTIANTEMAKQLQISVGSPLFVMETVMGDCHQIPVHYGKQYIVGDRYSFVR